MMTWLEKNCKHNFIYLVWHGYSIPNHRVDCDYDNEENDSGVILWDGYIIDVALCEMIAGFSKETKHLIMFAECYSGGAVDLKYYVIKVERGTKRLKKMKKAGRIGLKQF